MMNEQALNKKLAEWAGFRITTQSYTDFEPVRDERWWQPDGFEGKPNFIQSLDACFKWLVPKLRYDLWVHDMILIDWISSVCRGANPALALCLAIEKLTDSGD